jgi:hypothetical protein
MEDTNLATAFGEKFAACPKHTQALVPGLC